MFSILNEERQSELIPLTRFSLKNAAAILLGSILLIIGGIYAFTSLKVDLLPDVELPALTVQAVYPGATPADVEERVTRELERSLKALSGLESLTSQSMESFAVVQMKYPVGTDMQLASRQAEDAFKGLKLPEGVTPKVTRLNFGALPILNLAVFSKQSDSIEELIVQDIQPELEKIPGVSRVAAGGLKESYIRISVDPAKAKAYNLTLTQIQQKVQGLFLSFPAGSVVENDLIVPVRVEQRAAGLQELKRLAMDVQTGFPPVPAEIALEDIAVVQPVEEASELVRYNGKSALALSISKRQGANTVQIADQALAVLNNHRDRIDYALAFDQSEGIKQSVQSLQREGLYGALFASLAVLLFLRNLRATLIAVLSIPLSLLIASIALHRMNITLNIMTLGGMAVAVGRVVDDSIVVIENIYRRMRQRKPGEDRTQMTLEATKEIMGAITSSTLTTIVVFLPLGFVGGITGTVFKPFALTVVFAIVASLLVSVTLVPILAKASFGRIRETEERESALQRGYAAVLVSALRHKWSVIAVSLAVLAGSILLAPKLGFIFLPNEKQRIVAAAVQLPPASRLQRTDELSKQIEQMLREQPDVLEYVFTTIGGLDYRSGLKQENQAQYMMSVSRSADMEAVVKTLAAKMDATVKKSSPEGTVTVQEMGFGGPMTGTTVEVRLFGGQPDRLGEAAKRMEDRLKQMPALRSVKNNFREKQRQWTVRIDPGKAAAAGVDPQLVLGLVADRTRPVEIGTYKLDGKPQKLEAAYTAGPANAAELEQLPLFGKQGPVLLRDIAAVEASDIVSAIQKLDGKPYAAVSAEITGNNISQATQKVWDAASAVPLPEGVTIGFGGGSGETEKTFKDLGVAIAAAVGLVYLVMLVTFGQARIPFIILSSLLFVPVGAAFGLYWTGEPLSVSAMIGLLMLVGIVVTNAIVLIDRVRQNRDSGLTIREALIEAGKTRLRPILMTAFATVCALIPLALTESEGSLISKGLAVVVIGGLVTSTLLTLVIVPVMYELFFHRQRRRELRNKRR